MFNRNISKLIVTFAFFYSAVICHLKAVEFYEKKDLFLSYFLWFCALTSFLGALPIFDAGVVSLPMEGAPVDYFKLDGKPGVEEIIAGISQERPRLSWLPQGDQPPLLLEGKHLQEFLTCFQAESDSTLWYMFYDVV